MKASQRCIILAVDGTPTLGASMDLVNMTAEGPIGPYLAAVKLNDVLDSGFGQVMVAELSSHYPELILFVDRKLADVSATGINVIKRYVGLHDQGKGMLATVSLQSASPKTFSGLRETFPELMIAAMGVPTDWTADECITYHGMLPADCMRKWLGTLNDMLGEKRPQAAIASYDMLEMMAERFPWATCITPGIRDEWTLKEHQVRVASTYDALVAGAHYLVMGSQLTKGNPARDISAEKSQEMTAEMVKQALLAG